MDLFIFVFVYCHFLLFIHYSATQPHSPLLSCLFFFEGSQMAQSRYLFAISCFQMDLLSEAEASLSPVSDSIAEVLLQVTHAWEIIVFPICITSFSGKTWLLMDGCWNVLNRRMRTLAHWCLSFFYRFRMVQLVITFLVLFIGTVWFLTCWFTKCAIISLLMLFNLFVIEYMRELIISFSTYIPVF